jgi:hypothetical protein
MTESQLRALVREVIDSHLAGRGASPVQPVRPAPQAPSPLSLVGAHASHGQFAFPTPDACVIEPSVPCTHCGYCKSYGH